MFLNFENTEIKKGHAVRYHKSFNFGIFNNNKFTKVEFNDVYEHWYFESYAELFYNGESITKFCSTFYDSYGYGDSMKSMKEHIDSFISIYKIKKDDKLEIRLFARPIREFYFKKINTFYKLQKEAHFNFEDAEKFFKLPIDQRFSLTPVDEESFLDISYANCSFEPICFFKSLTDGFILKEEHYNEIKSQFMFVNQLTLTK